MFSLENIPTELHETTQLHVQNFNEVLARLGLDFPDNAAVISVLPKIFCCSEFIAQTCARQPKFLLELINSADLFSAEVRSHYRDELSQITIQNDVELMQVLRQFRNKQMLRIAWRDLAEWSDLDE
ncbi:MAG: bifunctional [glutamate--ammonia ligase]-adenylyl-L-tyrosine phosphorylase/[glutamate--ammonia-ligase] adenylyltransferase, partial [Methyloprofundus sp.]|nr:bifunctional [glutamate--ammonia ligase]-adenylyl-L-tyrosine phosphorylase/[glutamate--ammonia-ligase] adenylyltransferase [Methyloprofundus sp.]